MNRKRIILTVLLAAMSASVFAQRTMIVEPERSHIIEVINDEASSIHSLSCDFIQTKQLSLMNEKMESKGKMQYAQTDKLRWEYISPYSYIFILNGTSVTLKSTKKTDVIDVASNKIFQDIARIMMDSVTGKCLTDTSDFKSTLYVDGDEWIAELYPQKKEMKQMFKIIVLHFDRKDRIVKTIELQEKTGDTTLIALNNIEKNKTVNEAVFVVN